LALTKEKAYYRAVQRVVAAANSAATLKEKLNIIAKGTAVSMKAGASLVLLDSSRKKLVHSSSWRLPQFYLRKGVLDADKSLSEVLTGGPVVITDVGRDSRIQYPEMAARAGIVSILGVPVMSKHGLAVGSIRVYCREPREFTNQDIGFVTTMANLAAVALSENLRLREKGEVKLEQIQTAVASTALQQALSVTFAHPSEEEFARILDFYNVEWAYEPRSFPLKWDGERVTEMFTPDFYLPGLDLYVEITTLKQSLVTDKNRKLRHLRELYPEVKIMLLHRNEYDRLLARYGCGPLAHTRARGISRVLYSPAEIEGKVAELAERISNDYAGRRPVMVGVQRGFICFMADLIRHITIPLDIDFITISYYSGSDHSMFKITKDVDLNIAGRHIIVLEGIVDTGMTLNSILNHLRPKTPDSLAVCTLLDKRVRRIANIPLEYVGFEVQDEFVVGYGLDYGEEYRNLPFIGIPKLEKPPQNIRRGSYKK
jgi:bifunctional protein TilS/HprT